MLNVKITDTPESLNIVRAQLWANAWIATASAANCTRASAATTWADACLKEFDKRFGSVVAS